jgi:hypothetical protein
MWISGSITPGETGVYGIMGDASTTNVPGGRVCANTWIDSNGNLWLLGGAGYDSTGTKGFLDDLWQFNPSTGQWMWMNGSSTANQPVVYGTLATPSSTSTPGGRYCPSSWLDGNGNFWLFGGWYQSSSGNNSYPLNDLWEAGAPTSAPTFSPAAGSYNSTQTVTIAGVSSDAAIHFTTDGATPTASSSLYTGPITVSSTETLEAIAVVPGYLNSAPSTATYTLNQTTAATPQITPASGTYTSMQSVALLDSTPGATIYYTSDGTTPTANSSRYSGLISIAATTTLKAIAIAPNYGNSSVLTATYTLLLQPTATPTFSPATGTYTTAQSVMISDTTPSATIYYTTNGSAPTSASAIYSSPITVSMNETIQAAAIASGYSPSSTASATYTIAQATLATPTFSIAAGTYSTTQTVAISDTATNATICYTTDGSSPTTASTIYTGPISVTSSETLKAVAFKSGYTQSEVATVAYTITQSATATPTFSPVSGSYSAAQFVSIIDTATNATIYYTTDGTTPTSLSAVYSGPISVASSETIEAIAVASNNTRSGVATATYTIAQSVVATPTFSVASGVFTAPQTITIADTTTATTICYTIDGSTPTSASAIYTGPITVSATETVKAVAYKSGYIQSAVASATYVFPITPTITWPTPAAISYGTPLSATQLDATASVAGTFTYSSAVGVLLPAGSNTLSVAFTPRNQTEYTTATASVTLIVNVPSNPAPAISSISPAFVNAGSSDFTLTVNGSGFDSGSTVYWGSTALVTQFVSAKQLTAMVPAACVASTGVFAILVQSSTLGGGVSTALQFEVDSNAAGTILPPTISSTTVAVTAGSTAVYSVTIPSTITTLTVSCLNMPVGASCTYSATTHQIIITTSPNTPKGIYQITVVFAETSTIPANAVGLLPILLLPFAFAGIRRKTGFTALLCLILLTTTFFASGCSDSITQSAYSTTSSLVSLSIQ